MSTQIFSDTGTSVINLKLAAASFGNTTIQVFVYGLMGRNSWSAITCSVYMRYEYYKFLNFEVIIVKSAIFEGYMWSFSSVFSFLFFSFFLFFYFLL